MKNIFFVLLLSFIFLFSCKKKNLNIDTPTKGEITVLIDDNLYPIVEEQEQLFEFHYKEAKINLKSLSDKEISKQVTDGKSDVFVLSRDLNENEINYFKSKSIKQKLYPFAYSAIVLITNKNSLTKKLTEAEIKSFFSNSVQKVIFDNPNSFNLSYFMSRYKVNTLPSNISALKSNVELIDFISKNKDFIGVVDLNWISYPTTEISKMLEKIHVIPIQNQKNTAIKPEQISIADKTYPFIKTLYLHSMQGKYGLGVGFGGFMTSDIGQRIILKSGIQPFNMPSREMYFVK
jgi:phosphate transport system substrate-binding protein